MKKPLFEIKEGVHLKDVSFITSGNIDFEGNSLNLNSEKSFFAIAVGVFIAGIIVTVLSTGVITAVNSF